MRGASEYELFVPGGNPVAFCKGLAAGIEMIDKCLCEAEGNVGDSCTLTYRWGRRQMVRREQHCHPPLNGVLLVNK